MLSYPKEMFIETLREIFSQDSYYHFQRDQWGFPKTPDQTPLLLSDGLKNDLTTRLYIGDAYRLESLFYPAILVRDGGTRMVPISLNRDSGSILWNPIQFMDGYGNSKLINYPKSFLYVGASEGQISLTVLSRSARTCSELCDIIAIMFTDAYYDVMKNAGIAIKPNGINIGSPSESDDRNDKLFHQVITLDIRTEWRREIPVTSVVDRIKFCIEFVNVQDPNPKPNDLGIEQTIYFGDVFKNYF